MIRAIRVICEICGVKILYPVLSPEYELQTVKQNPADSFRVKMKGVIFRAALPGNYFEIALLDSKRAQEGNVELLRPGFYSLNQASTVFRNRHCLFSTEKRSY
jgi:hypothetical protein